jgi:hypothetical protein
MIPTIKTRLTLGDFRAGVVDLWGFRRADLVANAIVLVALVLAGALSASGWGLALGLLTLPVIALGRLIVTTAVAQRDARDFLTYITGLAEAFDLDEYEAEDLANELADVVPLHGEATDL